MMERPLALWGRRKRREIAPGADEASSSRTIRSLMGEGNPTLQVKDDSQREDVFGEGSGVDTRGRPRYHRQDDPERSFAGGGAATLWGQGEEQDVPNP